MSQALIALLVSLGVGFVAGQRVHVYTTKPGVTLTDLTNAGIGTACNRRRASCTIYRDGGYAEKPFSVAVCPSTDGGLPSTIIPPQAAQHYDRVVDPNTSCRLLAGTLTATQFNQDPAETTGACACWNPDAGSCLETLADGGTALPLHHNELQPGKWSGAGCVPKPCGEIYGISNWPTGCAR
jgi:hypothetical protein